MLPLPARQQLTSAYEILQFNAASTTLDELIVWTQWSRLDARLAALLTRHFAFSFHKVNPVDLWLANQKSPQPAVLMVLVEFAQLLVKLSPPLNELNEPKAFAVWRGALAQGVSPAPPQMFFVNEGMPAPAHDESEILGSLRPYSRWGFFATEMLAEAKPALKSPMTPTLLSPPQRLAILRKLMTRGRRISVEIYMQACAGRVHRRMAQRDLIKFKGLKAKGFTRGRIYHG